MAKLYSSLDIGTKVDRYVAQLLWSGYQCKCELLQMPNNCHTFLGSGGGASSPDVCHLSLSSPVGFGKVHLLPDCQLQP